MGLYLLVNNSGKEEIMGRKYFDCRSYPEGPKCSMILSADTEEELIEEVVKHNIRVHGDNDTKEFRELIRKDIKEGLPLDLT
ncbi:MAG: DUF1059 domain-containing protein [Desulfuromonadales bacterium]|nr:DUF1059 domain-containing protein [Desulfuromonadales bacterium]MDH4025620.1 DUF1059 domain-containing protein [Desulfuromonadales bacterium]